MTDITLAFEDSEAVEAAGIGAHYKLAAISVIANLRYLQHLSSELGKPIEAVTRDEIIEAFKSEQASNTEFASYQVRG